MGIEQLPSQDQASAAGQNTGDLVTAGDAESVLHDVSCTDTVKMSGDPTIVASHDDEGAMTENAALCEAMTDAVAPCVRQAIRQVAAAYGVSVRDVLRIYRDHQGGVQGEEEYALIAQAVEAATRNREQQIARLPECIRAAVATVVSSLTRMMGESTGSQKGRIAAAS